MRVLYTRGFVGIRQLIATRLIQSILQRSYELRDYFTQLFTTICLGGSKKARGTRFVARLSCVSAGQDPITTVIVAHARVRDPL